MRTVFEHSVPPTCPDCLHLYCVANNKCINWRQLLNKLHLSLLRPPVSRISSPHTAGRRVNLRPIFTLNFPTDSSNVYLPHLHSPQLSTPHRLCRRLHHCLLVNSSDQLAHVNLMTNRRVSGRTQFKQSVSTLARTLHRSNHSTFASVRTSATIGS